MGRPVFVALAVVATGCCLLLAGCGAGPPITSHPSSALSTHLVLGARTVRAGGELVGHIVVQNNTGHAIHTYGCMSIFQVLLRSATYTPTPAWLLCNQPITIPQGRSNYTVKVEARYNMCGTDPACTSAGPPPLPAGDYKATTYEQGSGVPVPAPIPVQVT
jgi:hypothetical protein